MIKKILAVALISVLIANLIWFGLGRSSVIVFWIVIGLVFLAAFFLKKFVFIR